MKKYKVTNFFENNKKGKDAKSVNKVILIAMSLYLISNLFMGTNKIKKLQEYIENNPYEKSEDVKMIKSNHIDINHIKRIYNTLGKNNISKFIVNNSTVEIEGQCQDLGILYGINDENIKDMSVNKIRKEGEAYIFNISYAIFDKVEIK